MKGEVFISYSQPDQACAFDLVHLLESQGIGCWIAPRDIAPAAEWAAAIIDAISAARAMVLVFSAHSNESPEVRREVERATHKRLAIVPFRIEAVLPSKSLEYFLSGQHWLDAFPPPLAPHGRRLCDHLKGHLAAGPPQSTARAASMPPPESGPPAAVTSASGAWVYSAPAIAGLGPEQLRAIEKELARYIGPIARHLVKQAAGRAATRESLIAQLAGELDDESERREFDLRCSRL
jgi:hypothetical protein